MDRDRIPLKIAEIIAVDPGNIQADPDPFLMADDVCGSCRGKCVLQVFYIFPQPGFGLLIRRLISAVQLSGSRARISSFRYAENWGISDRHIAEAASFHCPIR